MFSGSRKKKRDQGEVELNLAAMLDMAFQLLCFFILTFKPEGRRGRYSSTARCRVCARKAYDEQVALGAAGDEELRERLGVKLGLEPDPERGTGWKKYYKERDRRVVETAGPWRPR